MDQAQEIWITSLLESLSKGDMPSLRALKVKHNTLIAQGFDPLAVDPKIVIGGVVPTVLCLAQIQPEGTLYSEVQSFYVKLREMILKYPDKSGFPEEDLQFLPSFPNAIILIRILSASGHLFGSYTYTHENRLTYISVGHEESFDNLLRFPSVKSLVEDLSSRTGSRAEAPIHAEITKAIAANPYFRSRIEYIDPNIVFVLMPFTEKWSDRVYQDLIKSVIEESGYQALRSDNLHGPLVIEDIWIKINQCGLLIADVTGKNPNVMYELGIAHAIGKPVLIITQSLKDIPFDFRHLRHHEYEDNSTGFKDAKDRLQNAISETMSFYQNQRNGA